MAEHQRQSPGTIGSLPPRGARCRASTDPALRWLFTRDEQRVEIAARRGGRRCYRADIRWPNGRQETQRFVDSDAMFQHLAALSWQLRNSGFVFQAREFDCHDRPEPPAA